MVAARFLRALALLLIAWQAVVAQAHWDARPVATSVVAGGQAASAQSSRHDNPLDCPICRVLSHAGAYVTPGQASLAAIDSRPAAVALLDLPTLSVPQPPYAWRSRAPPLSLTA